ncbi:FAD-linked sulfhydryl oxidase ERV2 [Cordyceps militaris]|uniref:Sulfhydryl oxidase n=1 Tax=Cordyceps militaris TaxID=73501 RepID=A0A2H4SE37_CORMI|nr:FAD-linked sulfhydryl oxidase ERV2 [Cordyceps militaris]
MARRQHLTLSVLLIVFLLLSISYFFTSAPGAARDRAASFVSAVKNPTKPRPAQASTGTNSDNDGQTGKDAAAPSATPSAGFSIDLDSLPALDGDSIAPKLENATLKAELGRATWRFLHTMAARFPDKPTKEERTTFETFIQLFSRLYPCGDCARHFRGILAEYPPQSGSRSAAAGWLCFAHNLVNERLGKPSFDCNAIGDFYDCGCAEDDKKKDNAAAAGKDTTKKDDMSGKKKDEAAAAGDDTKKKGDKKKDEAVVAGDDSTKKDDKNE